MVAPQVKEAVMSRKWLAISVSLPLLVLVLGIVRAEYHLANARRWSFDVTGYDPRDLLRGHYLDYRLDLHEQAALETCDDDFGERCCLCLETTDATDAGEPPVVRRATCELALRRCDGILRTQHLRELTRYYIPEEHAQALTHVFQDAAREHKLVLAIDDNGRPQIDALLVDGQRIESVKH
jgi:uncharacterized membrane-anchored protein